MGRQVEGWWRTAPCVVLHPIIQIRIWTLDSAPSTFTLLPRAICILQVSFHCRWCHLSLQGPAEDSFKNGWKESFTQALSDLWSDTVYLQCCGVTVLCPRNIKVSKFSEQTALDRSVSHLLLSVTILTQVGILRPFTGWSERWWKFKRLSTSKPYKSVHWHSISVRSSF